MSVWLAGTYLMGRIYGSLTLIRNSYIAKSNHGSLNSTLYYTMVEAFPQFNWRDIDDPSVDPIRDLCAALWRMNAATFKWKTSDKVSITKAHVVAMLKEAKAVDHIQLFKDIGFLEYQCAESVNAKKRLYRQLELFESRLGAVVLRHTPAYEAAKWG